MYFLYFIYFEDVMDAGLLLKIFGATTALIGTGTGLALAIYNFLTGNANRQREEYKFAKDFFQSANEEELHPFVLEKGYQIIVGNKVMPMNEIEYLFSLKNSAQAIKDNMLARPYIEYRHEEVEKKIKYKKKFEAVWSRKWRIWMYIFLYALCFFLAFSSLVFYPYTSTKLGLSLTEDGLLIGYFLPLAYLSLRAGSKVYRAGKLIENQEKHNHDSYKRSVHQVSRRRNK